MQSSRFELSRKVSSYRFLFLHRGWTSGALVIAFRSLTLFDYFPLVITRVNSEDKKTVLLLINNFYTADKMNFRSHLVPPLNRMERFCYFGFLRRKHLFRFFFKLYISGAKIIRALRHGLQKTYNFPIDFGSTFLQSIPESTQNFTPEDT